MNVFFTLIISVISATLIVASINMATEVFKHEDANR
jgi:hypothetical protein